MRSINDLLSSFPPPYLWKQFFYDILFGLFNDRLSPFKLRGQLILLRPCNHSFLLCLLPEGSVGIFVFPIGVFPKLPDKRLSLFLVSSLLPIRNNLLLQHLLTDLPLKLLFCAQLEVIKQDFFGQLLLYEEDFLKDV
jgi:hypothetical protein